MVAARAPASRRPARSSTCPPWPRRWPRRSRRGSTSARSSAIGCISRLLSLPDQLKMRPNGALVRTMRPSPSSVAMANGVSLKKREKRTSDGAQGLLAVGAAAAVEDQGARFAELAIGEPRGAMEQPDRHDGAVAAHEVDVDDLGADFAVAAAAHQEARAVAAHDIGRASDRRTGTRRGRSRASRRASS